MATEPNQTSAAALEATETAASPESLCPPASSQQPDARLPVYPEQSGQLLPDDIYIDVRLSAATMVRGTILRDTRSAHAVAKKVAEACPDWSEDMLVPGLDEFFNMGPRLTDGLLTRALCLPISERWREAAHTAVHGDWIARCETDGVVLADVAYAALRAETRTLHRQLVPLWRRRANGARVLLLDTPMGGDFTLHDLLAGQLATSEQAGGFTPTDARLAALLRALRPDEQAVLVAWTDPGVRTWMDAALCAGATDPVVLGERVRRRVRSQLAEQARRRAQQAEQAAIAESRS
ncbi:hypothetical protein ACGFNY_44730 [Streptomyces chartreusis]|uniref:hypothetical protein n=1 Tax=Streptomyces chartreusis TaxID=1969 RepID=UPI00371F30FF